MNQPYLQIFHPQVKKKKKCVSKVKLGGRALQCENNWIDRATCSLRTWRGRAIASYQGAHQPTFTHLLNSY